MDGRWVRAGLVVAGVLSAASSARAAEYEFLAAPDVGLNRVYRLDKATGEMGACQYGLVKDEGATLCYPPGDNAGPQAQSEYTPIASHHTKEGGVFRIDVRAGTMSICYVLNEKVVCTPPAR